MYLLTLKYLFCWRKQKIRTYLLNYDFVIFMQFLAIFPKLSSTHNSTPIRNPIGWFSKFMEQQLSRSFLNPLYHFHPLHIQLENQWAITAKSSPLHIPSDWTQTENIWCLSASRKSLSFAPLTMVYYKVLTAFTKHYLRCFIEFQIPLFRAGPVEKFLWWKTRSSKTEGRLTHAWWNSIKSCTVEKTMI